MTDSFLITSRNEIIKKPESLIKHEKKLKKLQKQLVRKQEDSNRYENMLRK